MLLLVPPLGPNPPRPVPAPTPLRDPPIRRHGRCNGRHTAQSPPAPTSDTPPSSQRPPLQKLRRLRMLPSCSLPSTILHRVQFPRSSRRATFHLSLITAHRSLSNRRHHLLHRRRPNQIP